MRIKTQIFYSKIARRIFLLFVSCALLPIIILTGLSFNQVTGGLEDQYKKRLKHMTKSVGMSIYERLVLIETNLKMISSGVDSRHPSFAPADPAQEKNYAQWFKGIIHITPAGERTPLFKVIDDFPELASILPDQEADQKSSGRTIVFTQDMGKAARVLMLLPMEGRNTASGFLGAEVNGPYLWGIGPFNTIPQQTRLCVLDQSNRVLLNSFASNDVVRKFRRKLQAGNSRHFEFETGNTEYLANFWALFMRSGFEAPNWIIILSQDKADVLAPLNHFKTIYPLVILLSVWVVLLLSIFYIRKSLIPLESLKAGTERITQGDFSTPVEVTSKDEFADLSTSFNAMSGQLSRQFKTLKTVAEIDRAILSSLHPDEIVNTMLSRLFDFLHCELVCIGLADQDSANQFQYFIQEKGHERIRLEQTVTMEPGHIQQLLSQEAVLINEGEEPPGYLAVLQEHSAESFGVIPVILKENLAGILVLGYGAETNADKEDDIAHSSQLAVQMAVALANAQLIRELEELSWGAIQALARTVDAKSSWTAGHSERVTIYAMQIANALQLPEDRQEVLHRAGLLHDIGKIGVPVAILDKPGRLNDEEYKEIRNHPSIGGKIMEPIGAYEEIIPIIVQHHENYDGTGYPDGLQKEAITLEARILSVADVFDALISDRPYREGWTRERITSFIQKQSGKKFDPEIVTVFLDLLEQKAITLDPLLYFEDTYTLPDDPNEADIRQ